jgi:hypothetical protein
VAQALEDLPQIVEQLGAQAVQRIGGLEPREQFAVQEQRQRQPLLVLRQEQGLAGVGQHPLREPRIRNQVVANIVHAAHLVDVAQVLLQTVDHQCRPFGLPSESGTIPL